MTQSHLDEMNIQLEEIRKYSEELHSKGYVLRYRTDPYQELSHIIMEKNGHTVTKSITFHTRELYQLEINTIRYITKLKNDIDRYLESEEYIAECFKNGIIHNEFKLKIAILTRPELFVI